MKHVFTKTLSGVLSLLLILSCCVPAFAATKDTVTQYGKAGGYLAIGDSISRGCGADGFYLGQHRTNRCCFFLVKELDISS